MSYSNVEFNTGLLTLSLNGPDNVGKTAQLKFMPKHIEVRTSIHHYDEYMGNMVKKNYLQKWWFDESNAEEFIKTIMNAVDKRAHVPTDNNKTLVAFDRGGIMFEAVCIATVALKDKCTLEEAKKRYNSILKKYAIEIPRENIRILLKHGDDIEESIRRTLMLERSYDDIYETYQNLLHKQLEFQECNGSYTHIINVTDKCTIEIQNEIRLIIKECSPPKVDFPMNPMFQHLDMIIAFGGMSESGKSSLATGICKKLESIGVECKRLKIAYFMELASNTLGSDVYQLPEEEQADELIKQLDHYLNRHYWIIMITIESLHVFASTKALKARLGSLIQIVYVDTTLDTRIQRSLPTTENFYEKDAIKKSRGADRIKTIANFIINNDLYLLNESIEDLFEMLKVKSQKLTHQSKVSIRYPSKMNLFSHQFVLSAGTVLIRKSTREVCLIHVLDDRDEWVLPKGRKNTNETLSEAALRETYEETGYHCSLMPLIMQTRAPPNNENWEDVPREVSDCCEPFSISIRLIRGDTTNQKHVFWYVGQVDEQIPRDMNTQLVNENFEAKFIAFSEANRLLSFADDRELVKNAFLLFEKTYPAN